MPKKILVTKDWHKKAMAALESESRSRSFIQGLEMFLVTKLSPEQQKQLEIEINTFIEGYNNLQECE